MTAQGEIDLDAIEQAVEARFADVAPLKRHQGYPGDISAIVDAPLTIRQARALVALVRQAQQPAGGLDGVIAAIEAAGFNWSVSRLHRGYIAYVTNRLSQREHLVKNETASLAALTAAAQAAGILIPPPRSLNAEIASILVDAAELPDRTSPADHPGHLLIHPDELKAMILRAFEFAKAEGVMHE